MVQAQRGKWWLNGAQLVLFGKNRRLGAEQSRLSHDEGEFLGWWKWTGLVWVSACEGEWYSHTQCAYCISAHETLIEIHLAVALFWGGFSKQTVAFLCPILQVTYLYNMTYSGHLKILFGDKNNISKSSGWCLQQMLKKDSNSSRPVSVTVWWVVFLFCFFFFLLLFTVRLSDPFRCRMR